MVRRQSILVAAFARAGRTILIVDCRLRTADFGVRHRCAAFLTTHFHGE